MTNCHRLKMTADNGEKCLTYVTDTEQLLCLIQSIPSPKAEQFKMWLARVGSERIAETIDPEQAIDRAFETYMKFEADFRVSILHNPDSQSVVIGTKFL